MTRLGLLLALDRRVQNKTLEEYAKGLRMHKSTLYRLETSDGGHTMETFRKAINYLLEEATSNGRR
jgi:hypothetical protein